jgi:hypothetical protein
MISVIPDGLRAKPKDPRPSCPAFGLSGDQFRVPGQKEQFTCLFSAMRMARAWWMACRRSKAWSGLV